MSGIGIIALICDYDIKDEKSHTFMLKHDNNIEKETFNIKNQTAILWIFCLT